MRRLAQSAFAALCLVASAGAGPGSRVVLDGFEDPSLWHAAPASGVSLALSRTDGAHGGALRLDFDFAGHAGWAAVRREIPVELPENWEISFSVRGAAPGNDLEVKLVDASGDNVWWTVRRDWTPPGEWATVTLKKRQFSFAWGPSEDKTLRRFAAIEFAVTARAGGRGWIALDDLAWIPLPPPGLAAHAAVLTASSSESGHPPARAMDGSASTAWRSGSRAPASLMLDLGERREFGGLTIEWEPGRFARRYSVLTSDDGESWVRAREITAGGDGRSDISLPESESRYVRLDLAEPGKTAGAAAGFGIREVVLQPLPYSETPNAFFGHVAAAAPRGEYPRSFSGEQSYWTVVGVPGDSDCALFSEDGAVEPSRGAFSLEPFLLVDGHLYSWADARSEHALVKKGIPIPQVRWTGTPLPLEITALASGVPGRASVGMRYVLSNPGARIRAARLILAVRPFQVDPPQQFLNGPGGVTPIRSLAFDGSDVVVDGEARVHASRRPTGFGAMPFESGSLGAVLASGKLPPDTAIRDDFGYASGALAWDFSLPPGGVEDVLVWLPIHRGSPPPPGGNDISFSRQLATATQSWDDELGRVVLAGPPAAQDLLDTVRTNLAAILIERDGPALRPGTRAYARSWIRDGAMMSAALLRLGRVAEVRDYVAWFAGFQDPDGRVPCCVDRRGGDPVVENDSHGELIFAIAEYWRFTKDRAFLESMFPHVEGAVAWIDRERQRRRTEEYRTPAKLSFFGLLPESISHEGYSAKAVHSYWDDFWALKGLKDAVDLAAALGRDEKRSRWAGIRDEFARELHASIARVERERGIDFIPGSADLADFDPTSTTIALDPAGELGLLPQAPLRRTFERYFEEFEKRDQSGTWEDYTPYELRNVGAFVRLGWRERAQTLLRFFLPGRRPPEWGVWAEVVGRDPRKPRFVGDIPHAWVGSDFIRAVLDLYAWERESDGALVLASGIPTSWLEGGAPVGVANLGTPHGPLTYSMRAGPGGLRISIAAGLTVPPGGVVLRPPLASGTRAAVVNGKRVAFEAEELRIREVPAEVVFGANPGE